MLAVLEGYMGVIWGLYAINWDILGYTGINWDQLGYTGIYLFLVCMHFASKIEKIELICLNMCLI